MYAKCPYCETIFAISEQHLQKAAGRVRCGHCSLAFNALDHQIDIEQKTQHKQVDEPITTKQEELTDDDISALSIDLSNDIPQALEEDIVQLRKKPSALMRFFQWFIFISLIGLGAGQYLWFMPQDALARFPQASEYFTPYLVKLERLPAYQRDPRLIRIEQREVKAHPKYKGALQINGMMKNTAAFDQPLPTLRLTLFDINGKTIAARDFKPAEYQGPSVNSQTLMPANLSVPFHLLLASPETEAVSFKFKFF